MRARMTPLLLLAVCATCCLHRPPPILVEKPAGPCLHEPPPVRVDVPFAEPGEEGCPETFAACFSAEQGTALAKRLNALESWSDDAWIRCGEREQKVPDEK